jgi:hypothetical protein
LLKAFQRLLIKKRNPGVSGRPLEAAEQEILNSVKRRDVVLRDTTNFFEIIYQRFFHLLLCVLPDGKATAFRGTIFRKGANCHKAIIS